MEVPNDNYKTLITFHYAKSSLFLNVSALFGVLFSEITYPNSFSLNNHISINRINPYLPIFNNTPAEIIDPYIGAST